MTILYIRGVNDALIEFRTDISKPFLTNVVTHLNSFMLKDHITFTTTVTELDILKVEFADMIFSCLFAYYYYCLYLLRRDMVLVETEIENEINLFINNKRNRRRIKRQDEKRKLDLTIAQTGETFQQNDQLDEELDEEDLQPNIDESTPSAVTSSHPDIMARSKETDITVKPDENDQETNTNDSNPVAEVKKSQKKDKRRKRDKSVHLVTVVNRNFVPDPVHFFQACLYGHKEIVRQLLTNHRHELDIQQLEPVTGYTSFHLACSGGHLSVVQQLMTRFGNEICKQLLSRDGKSGLFLASEFGRKEVVQTILNKISKKEVRLVFITFK